MILNKWKTIPGFEKYEVSVRGHVRLIASAVRCKKTGRFIRRVLSQMKCSKGYLRVDIYSDTVGRKTIRVHSLVARTFIPNPENKDTVNHIDMCYTNNNVENLEWMTNVENIKHSYENGRAKKNYEPHYLNY